MIVGIDARLALVRGRGWGRYATEFLRQIGDFECIQWRVLLPDCDVGRALAASLPPHVPGVLQSYRLPAGEDYLRDSMNGPDPVKLLGPVDVLHSLTRFVAETQARPVIATVHDVAPLSIPPFKTEIRESTLSAVQRLRDYDCQIIAVSETTRRDLIKFGGVEEPRVHVIPQGADALGRNGTSIFAINMSNRPSREGDPHILLYVGGAGENKNLHRLLEAVKIAASRTPVQLWLVGALEWGYSQHLGESMVSSRPHSLVRFYDYVDDERLRDLYRSADMLMFPSLHEGFGLPVVEAMAQGLPVCCSDIPIMREVAGNAATFFNPYDVRSIADAITNTLTDTPGRLARARKGILRSNVYSWRSTVAGTIDVYTDTLNPDLSVVRKLA